MQPENSGSAVGPRQKVSKPKADSARFILDFRFLERVALFSTAASITEKSVLVPGSVHPPQLTCVEPVPTSPPNKG